MHVYRLVQIDNAACFSHACVIMCLPIPCPSPPSPLPLSPSHQFDEDMIAKLQSEDLVDSLLAEMQEDMPELLKPLLHDRCVAR